MRSLSPIRLDILTIATGGASSEEGAGVVVLSEMTARAKSEGTAVTVLAEA